MSSFAEYIEKLQDLTQKNLDILNLLNDSLYSRQLRNEAIINNTTYSIPSFLYIENKLNDLENNWKRLVNAPLTGEAGFVFDGNTQHIQVFGFENSPVPVNATGANGFYVESNDIFKDFVSPLIYIKYNLAALPESINKVAVRKVTFNNDSLYNVINGLETKSWTAVNAILAGYKEDVDYALYDTNYELPVRYNDYNGTFNTSDIALIDGQNLTWRFTADTITYTYSNNELTKQLKVGDYLITGSNRCKVKITAINLETRVITVHVESGFEDPSNVTSFRFWKNNDYVTTREIKVPLEEDKYIVVFIAPINSTVNVRAAWGEGQVIAVDNLLDDKGRNFRDVYNQQIRNIGDVLYDLTKFTTTTLSNVAPEELNRLTTYKPTFNNKEGDPGYSVVLLNEHLLDNKSLDYLRKLNVQKAQLNNDLQAIQDNIDKINNTLATTDFSSQDVVTRQDLEATLAEYNLKKTQTLTNLTNIINQITIEASSTTLPTSKSKYVIAGGIDTDTIKAAFATGSRAEVIHIELLYRYKNINKDATNATTINNAITVSTWNKYLIDYRQKVAGIVDGEMTYQFENDNTDGTTGDWRTYQIPITQGETVDMRYRVQYDLGYPYVSLFSDWSDVINVEFPADLVANNDIIDIVTVNDKDARENLVKCELNTEGVSAHINDKLIDQDITYFHRPESIASGFYTEDSKRIISLKEKLFELNNEINALKVTAFGSNFKDLTVIANVAGGVNYEIPADSAPVSVILPAASEMENWSTGSSVKVSTVLFTITNSNAKYPINIYSMFPGPNTTSLVSPTIISKFNYKTDFTAAKIKIQKSIAGTSSYVVTQYANQCVYFRNNDKFDVGKTYTYSDDDPTSNAMNIIPFITDLTTMQMNTGTPGDYITINPGEAITIPVQVKVSGNEQQTKGISFDIWDSPFQNPLTFTANIIVPSGDSGIKHVTESIKNSTYVATPARPRATTGALKKVTSKIL